MSENSNLTDGMHILVDALKKNDIDAIYGVVGIPITDFAREAQKQGIRYIGFKHEQSAGNAAAIAGYLTKKPGICLTVSAPGYLNGLTALANATVNGFPMIQISGSSDRATIDLQQGDYEELDQMSIAKPFVKASYRINKPEDIGIGLARAIHAATSGRPGGVYLDVTTALLGSVMDKDEAEKTLFKVEDIAPASIPSTDSVDKALKLLASAKKPLIILGKGAAYAQADKDIKDFAEKTEIPFLPMSMAKGLIPDNHPQCAAAARSFVLENADVVVLLGARLNWLLQHGKGKHWNPDVRFVQFEIDPKEIDSNRPIEAPVVGDIVSSMKVVMQRLPEFNVKADKAWIDAVQAAKQKNVEKMAVKLNTPTQPMNFFNALKAIKEVVDENKDIYLTNDGANTLDDTRNVIDMYYPRRRLDCGTWGVMGVALGFSIGAAVTSGKPVLAIEGDSAFSFNGMEVSTICEYNLPVTVVVFNNGGIYRGDHVNLGGGKDPSPTTLIASARFDKLGEAFGANAYNVKTPEELKEAVANGIKSLKPTVINCVIDTATGTESGHITALNPKKLN